MAVNSCDPIAKVAAAAVDLLYYQFTAPNNSTKSQVTFVIRGRRLSNVYGKEEAGVMESHVAWARTGATGLLLRLRNSRRNVGRRLFLLL